MLFILNLVPLLFRVYSSDIKYRYSPLLWLCINSKGATVLNKLIIKNPELGKRMKKNDLFLKVDEVNYLTHSI